MEQLFLDLDLSDIHGTVSYSTRRRNRQSCQVSGSMIKVMESHAVTYRTSISRISRAVYLLGCECMAGSMLKYDRSCIRAEYWTEVLSKPKYTLNVFLEADESQAAEGEAIRQKKSLNEVLVGRIVAGFVSLRVQYGGMIPLRLLPKPRSTFSCRPYTGSIPGRQNLGKGD